MGEQQSLVETGAVGRQTHRQRHAGQRLEPAFGKGQGHQPGAGRRDRQAELARHVIGQPGRAHLGDRFAAGGQHQIAAAHATACAVTVEIERKAVVGLAQFAQRRVQPQPGPGAVQFGQQHGDDLFCRAVAEQLPQRLFVPGDAVAIDQVDEIPLGVACQRRFGEMRILREEILRVACRLVKLQRPPPEMRIFSPGALA